MKKGLWFQFRKFMPLKECEPITEMGESMKRSRFGVRRIQFETW